MKKLLAILAVAGLVLAAGSGLACQKMGGGGDDEMKETIADLEDMIEMLEDDVEALSTSLTELQDEYDEHLEEFHGEKPAPRPPVTGGGGSGGGEKPPKERIK